MKIIGIAGTNGSGKDSVGQIVQDTFDYLFVPVTEILRDELKSQGKSITRENMRKLGDSWRREQGLSVLIDKAVEVYNSKGKKYKGLVVSSIRNTGEAKHIHDLGGTIIWVDADPKIRYQRVVSRKRSAEDVRTYEEFLKEEQDEMHKYGDEASLSFGEIKEMADIFIDNNFDNLKALKPVVEQCIQ